MLKLKSGLTGVVLCLDIVATPLLVFILMGIWAFRDRLFTIGNPLGIVELIMLVGMGTVLLFNIFSIAWLVKMRFKNAHRKTFDSMLMGLGILCIVMMIAEKVMADEVAHETVAGWSVQGEYLLLYGMLVPQFIFNLLVGTRLLLGSMEPAAKPRGLAP